jgi:NADPH:quinone reductase-like Zn-dependent oxidoreductase
MTSSVRARDWHIMHGDPYLARLTAPAVLGFSGPKMKIRGSDFAGRVEAVGRGVTRLGPSDEVYGHLGEAGGAFAGYVCVPDGGVERKPANLTFAQAAAVPLAGSTALVGLRDLGRVQPGQQVLVNGASGGVGTFAVQIAKALDAEVTGLCSTWAALGLPPAPERALGWLLGGRDGRLLLVAVGAVLGAPLAALAAVTATSALSLGLRVAFLRRRPSA